MTRWTSARTSKSGAICSRNLCRILRRPSGLSHWSDCIISPAFWSMSPCRYPQDIKISGLVCTEKSFLPSVSRLSLTPGPGLILFPPPVEALVPSPEERDTYPVNTLSLQNPSVPPYGAPNDSHGNFADQSANRRQSSHFLEWKAHWPLSRHGPSTDPYDFIASVYESTWESWDTRCRILHSLVRQLGAFRQEAGIFDSDFDATGLHRSQRLKELVVRSQKILSSTMACIRAILLTQKENSCSLQASSQNPTLRLREGMVYSK